MDIALPLDKMTVADKLALMEILWDDLGRTPQDVLSPAWHGEVLAAREKQLQNGQTGFIDFAEMCDRIKKEIKCET